MELQPHQNTKSTTVVAGQLPKPQMVFSLSQIIFRVVDTVGLATIPVKLATYPPKYATI
jgi:hypothetical protein